LTEVRAVARLLTGRFGPLTLTLSPRGRGDSAEPSCHLLPSRSREGPGEGGRRLAAERRIEGRNPATTVPPETGRP